MFYFLQFFFSRIQKATKYFIWYAQFASQFVCISEQILLSLVCFLYLEKIFPKWYFEQFFYSVSWEEEEKSFPFHISLSCIRKISLIHWGNCVVFEMREWNEWKSGFALFLGCFNDFGVVFEIRFSRKHANHLK